MLLLVASYIFYAYAGWECLVFIGVTTLTTYAAGHIIDANHTGQKKYLAEHKAELSKEEKKAYKEKQKNIRFVWMTVCLVLNFGILAVLKYTNFAIANVNGILQATGSDKVLAFRDLILPLGISFYTFQSMGYLIDIHRGKYPAQKNVFKFALFVSFFPQLIQGPISRYDDLEKGLFASHCFDWGTISFGLQRILWGYFKKLVIADRMLQPQHSHAHALRSEGRDQHHRERCVPPHLRERSPRHRGAQGGGPHHPLHGQALSLQGSLQRRPLLGRLLLHS